MNNHGLPVVGQRVHPLCAVRITENHPQIYAVPTLETPHGILGTSIYKIAPFAMRTLVTLRKLVNLTAVVICGARR